MKLQEANQNTKPRSKSTISTVLCFITYKDNTTNYSPIQDLQLEETLKGPSWMAYKIFDF